MNSHDPLIKKVEHLIHERRAKRRENGECDLCGNVDSHLIEGVCQRCRSKYNLKSGDFDD